MKHALLIIALLVSSPAFAGDIPWLAEVTTPPDSIPEPQRPLSPLLETDDGKPITTRDGWKAKRSDLRQAWLDVLGPLPQAPAGGITLETISEETLDNCTRALVRYEVEPGRVIEGYLLRPKGESTEKRPAVVVFHGTNVATNKTVAGLVGDPDRHMGPRLAARGFVVFCPANFLWEEKNYDASVAAARKRHPKSLGMATMLADGMRAVDILAALPDVDPERIGASGHSLGAKEVLYLMAFDDRVKAGVSSEGGISLPSTNWDAPWYLGPAAKKSDFPRDHHELLAIIAPRPLLVLGGETGRGAADGNRSWPHIAAAQKVYRLYGEPVRLGLLNHGEGHKFSPASGEKSFAWLEAGLK